MKKTLYCIHVLPSELEMLERLIFRLRKALSYLDSNDDLTLKVTLNLNPELTDWDNSEYKQEYFINRFEKLFNGIKNINEILLDTSCWGTTQQKRDCIKLDYDQFIFCDPDIIFHEHLLKHQLNFSYNLKGNYLISPSLPKFRDKTWDSLCHQDFIHESYDALMQDPEAAIKAENQQIEYIVVEEIPYIKFSCGFHTLYSKEFWNTTGIPEELGGYGPEDTYAILAGSKERANGVEIKQFVIKSIYIVEEYNNRTPSFINKIKIIDKKQEMFDKSIIFIGEFLETIKQYINDK
jgi:hypothetical protein